MKDFRDADWEDLARSEPYFPVLTNEGFSEVESNREATAAFFETGEADISSLFEAISSLLGRELRPDTTLDFGCGAGRLTLPLARRSGKVTGCDIAPTMLAHARQNLERAGFSDVTLILNDAMTDLSPNGFDFVCSLLVFQYVPPSTGYPLIRTLLRLLAPNGVAAIHLMFEQPGARLRRLIPFLRGRSRLLTGPSEPRARQGMRVFGYDQSLIARDIRSAGARLTGRLPLHLGDADAVLIIEKSSE